MKAHFEKFLLYYVNLMNVQRDYPSEIGAKTLVEFQEFFAWISNTPVGRELKNCYTPEYLAAINKFVQNVDNGIVEPFVSPE